MTRMARNHWSTGILVILILAISGAGLFWGLWQLSDFLSYIPQFLIGAIFVVIFWGVGQNIKSVLGQKEKTTIINILPFRVNQNYKDLAVYYQKMNGSPETPESTRKRYLIDRFNNKAFPMLDLPDWLAPAIKAHEIYWCAFDDERSLNKEIRAKFKLEDVSDLRPEKVGLTYSEGKLVKDNKFADLVSKLNGRRIADLQIAILRRRYFFSFVQRVLLVDFKSKEIWYAPSSWQELKDKEILNAETYQMRFYEKCGPWCKREFNFQFILNYYPDSKLLSSQ
jgi:hypothetical protein